MIHAIMQHERGEVNAWGRFGLGISPFSEHEFGLIHRARICASASALELLRAQGARKLHSRKLLPC
jgi:hypothetical protein